MKIEYIKIQEKEYKLKIGFGVMMAFEDETSKAITDIKGKTEILKLAYLTLQYNNEHFKYSYRTFVDDILDENPALFIELITTISSLLFGKSEDASEGKKK
ncbi:MAG: hypothetical protein WAO52_02915 [Prolixibacteraceae bacterium]